MKACGNTAPLHIKSTFNTDMYPSALPPCTRQLRSIPLIPQKDKKEWINKERKRWAKTFNIPIHEQMPEGFPVNTLTVMRALCALTSLYEGREEEGQKKLLGLMDVLLKKFWIDHERVYEKEVFGKVFEDVLGKEEAEKSEFELLITLNHQKSFPQMISSEGLQHHQTRIPLKGDC